MEKKLITEMKFMMERLENPRMTYTEYEKKHKVLTEGPTVLPPKESDDHETHTPIKPVTIYGKTYNFVEDLPIRELGIGGYAVDNENGIVMVDGDTPLQDWLDNDMGGDEDFMDDMDWVKSITVPDFTNEELDEIKETVMRLLSPGFHEDYEVGSYLSSVANNDPKTEKLLVKWLKSQGVNFYQPEYRDYMSKKNKN
jgi:hypothetical protein